MKYCCALLFICVLSFSAFSQPSVEKHFVMISKAPHTITYKNRHKLNHRGGHLQGIQAVKQNGEDIFVVTGSSSTYSYYATLGKVGGKYEVIETKKLLNKPYKHAGGFQINDDMMAIGIEDNEAKNTSMVFIYKAVENGAWGTEPFTIIKRDGETKRMTAGCVAIASLEENTLVIVGDWDTKNLDFYLMKPDGKHDLVATLETNNLEDWLSYQNINLVRDEDGNLYLIGLGSQGEDDMANLYKLNISDWKNISLTKVRSRNFGSQKKTKFRWGAGVYLDDGYLKIISCGDDLKSGEVVNVYR